MQLPKRPIGRNRDQHPVTEQREAEWNELQPAAANRRQHDQIGESTIAGEQVKQAQEQQRLRKNRIEARRCDAQAKSAYNTQNTGLSSPASTVPPMKKIKPRKPSKPALRMSCSGRLVWTRSVCM